MLHSAQGRSPLDIQDTGNEDFSFFGPSTPCAWGSGTLTNLTPSHSCLQQVDVFSYPVLAGGLTFRCSFQLHLVPAFSDSQPPLVDLQASKVDMTRQQDLCVSWSPHELSLNALKVV